MRREKGKMETIILDSNFTEVFAIPGQDSIIDAVRPSTGRSWINGNTLAEIRDRDPRYSEVRLMKYVEWAEAKAQRQHTPIEWWPSTAEKYEEMLCALPPEVWIGGAFLMGEPTDHSARDGAPMFQAYRHKAAGYFASNRGLTRKEFEAELCK